MQELADTFGEAAARAGDIKPVLVDFSYRMKGSINENFISGGRPVKWTPTQDPPPNHRATLINTGALYDSATAFTEGNTDVVLAAGGSGQPPAKAPTLQYGANYAAKQRVAGTPGGGTFASKRTRQNVHRSAITIPARPYLIIQDADLDYLGKALPNYVFLLSASAPIRPSMGIF
jgi:phage gpG-like protein